MAGLHHCYFKISVGDAYLMQILQYIDDLPNVKRNDLMVHFSEVFFEEVLEGSPLTKLQHKVEGFFILKWGIYFYDANGSLYVDGSWILLKIKVYFVVYYYFH